MSILNFVSLFRCKWDVVSLQQLQTNYIQLKLASSVQCASKVVHSDAYQYYYGEDTFIMREAWPR